MPRGAFRVQRLAPPSPWRVISALQNYTQPLVSSSSSKQSWRVKEVGETVVAARLVRCVREPFWEALVGGAQLLGAVPLPAGGMEGGSGGPTLDKQHCFWISMLSSLKAKHSAVTKLTGMFLPLHGLCSSSLFFLSAPLSKGIQSSLPKANFHT